MLIWYHHSRIYDGVVVCSCALVFHLVNMHFSRLNAMLLCRLHRPWYLHVYRRNKQTLKTCRRNMRNTDLMQLRHTVSVCTPLFLVFPRHSLEYKWYKWTNARTNLRFHCELNLSSYSASSILTKLSIETELLSRKSFVSRNANILNAPKFNPVEDVQIFRLFLRAFGQFSRFVNCFWQHFIILIWKLHLMGQKIT